MSGAERRGRDRWLTGEWPGEPNPVVPWTDVLIPPDFDPWIDHCKQLEGDAVSRELWEATTPLIEARWHEVQAGRVPTPDAELQRLVARIGLDQRHWTERRPAKLAVSAMSDAGLAQLATDWVPDLGDQLGQVLGHWIDQLARDNPGQRAAMLAALAGMMFVPQPDGLTAMRRLFRVGRSRESVAVRAAVRAVSWTPWTLWTVEAHEEGRLRLTDRCELYEDFSPSGWVSCPSIGSVDGKPVASGDVVAARVVRTEQGWQGRCVLRLPGVPPVVQSRDWIRFLGYRVRAHNMRLTRENMLAVYGHVLVRWAHEWCWRQAC